MSRILITGSTGFVGRQLVSTLSDRLLTLAVRRTTGESVDARRQILVQDMNRDADWASALAAVDCVVHLAAHVHVMTPGLSDSRKFYEVNEFGTEKLAKDAAAAGVRRFIFLSSVKVNGEATAGIPFRASDLPQPLDDYGKSKLYGEERLRAIGKQTGLEVIVIRPTLVYGPGVRANFLKLLSYTYKQLPLPLGSIRNQRSMISIWNLCDLIRRAIDVPHLESEVFMASDGADLSTPELIRKLAAAMNRRSRLIPVPVSLLKVVGTLAGKREVVARLCGSLAVDLSETRKALKWEPPLSVDDSIARTVEWYLQERGVHAA